MAKYDVGIVGLWSGCNYGSIATYYALNQVVSSMGKSVLMIDKPILTENDVELEETHSRIFGKKHYNISKQYRLNELDALNDICDAFVIGSDQVWNYGISKNFGNYFYFDFVNDDKKKIAYAVSFGHGVDFASPEKRKEIAKYMSRFDGISTREADGVRLCKDAYGIKAQQVLDPVFLADPEIYTPLIDGSKCHEDEPFLLTYILDPTPEKREAILHLSKQLGSVKIINMLDGLPWTFEKNKKLTDLPNCIPKLTVEDWLYYISHSRFLLTDSCHGASFALIFKKDFIAITNKNRGISRFKSLSQLFHIENRVVSDPTEILTNESLLDSIDYAPIEKIMQSERKRCMAWLENKLNNFKDTKNLPNINEIIALHANNDFIKIRMLATLLRDYGVKHIVLSPGGRDVPLVRMFEYNEGTFVLHHVTDERSAAYYGMGIAAQLRQIVACVCTSGTAASNYLPAVTEAYYTGIPLIVITADRYTVYHEHGEDRTIPQNHIYDGVVKKSVTLPEGSGYKAEYQTRRDISDCILETIHNGCGPAHINIAIDNILIGAKAPREAWKLLPKIYPHILRVGFNDGEKKVTKWLTAMQRSQRILVVYGQNPPPTQQQKKNIEDFAKKYNCVIVTDFISNLDCAYSLKPYNMLRTISQAEFNEKLSPDILITVGGKRLMNDPLTFKIRGGLKNIRHWDINPNGKIKDFYFRLSSVIEMSQDRFFEWFSSHAGDSMNNGQYYNSWRQLTEKHDNSEIKAFNSHYVQSKFLPVIPANSILHLGVGLSFFDCRRYSLDKTVETHCNMGTNGIDGCTSTFMGQCSVVKERLCFLLVGDLSFFYDMNGIWNKVPQKNIRILMVNNNGSGLLRGHNLKAITSVHNTSAKGWVESTGFKYMSAKTKEEYKEKLQYFVKDESEKALFLEVFCK